MTGSVLSSQVQVGEGSFIDEAVVLPGVRIGAHCRLRRVIIDSGTEIPDGTVMGWGTTPSASRVMLLTRESATQKLRSVA